uniref:Copper transport protein n=1 Tax=Rhodnius prolixus TaxID=13249 RepID=T1HSR1_RHOPR
MFFKFGYELHQLLFSSLNITSVTGLIGVSAVTVVLVLILEASKVALAHSKFYSAILRPNDRPDCFTDDMFLVETQSPSNSIRYFWLGVELGFYIIELILGYVIMLIVMTYNGYLMLSVLLGSGIGYFLGAEVIRKLSRNERENSSLTSSTEAISESVREEQENKCCSGDASSEAETKY